MRDGLKWRGCLGYDDFEAIGGILERRVDVGFTGRSPCEENGVDLAHSLSIRSRQRR